MDLVRSRAQVAPRALDADVSSGHRVSARSGVLV